MRTIPQLSQVRKFKKNFYLLSTTRPWQPESAEAVQLRDKKILLKNLVHMGIFIVSTGACLFLLNLNLMIFFPWVGLKLLQDGPTGKVAWTGNPNKVASQRHEHEHDVQSSQQNARTKPRDQKDSWLLAKYKRIATWFWPFPHLHSFFPIHPPPVSVSRGS